jgi:hypothetical protein
MGSRPRQGPRAQICSSLCTWRKSYRLRDQGSKSFSRMGASRSLLSILTQTS